MSFNSKEKREFFFKGEENSFLYKEYFDNFKNNEIKSSTKRKDSIFLII
jgi:hypothetical protein